MPVYLLVNIDLLHDDPKRLLNLQIANLEICWCNRVWARREDLMIQNEFIIQM